MSSLAGIFTPPDSPSRETPNADQIRTYPALRRQGRTRQEIDEPLTVEKPLQIVVNGSAFSMTMQTPGAERFLVRGLLHAEAINEAPFLHYEQSDSDAGTVVRVEVAGGHDVSGDRRLASTSSCGLCGKQNMEGLFEGIAPVRKQVVLQARALQIIHENIRQRQRTFRGTGGCHAAGAATAAGDVLCVFEDIGRHNAVDKVVGFLLENSLLPLADVLTVSGRVSFEIVQKCARAGIPVLSAISAPSSLAVEMAERWGLTLAAFCREDRATFYSGLERVGEA